MFLREATSSELKISVLIFFFCPIANEKNSYVSVRIRWIVRRSWIPANHGLPSFLRTKRNIRHKPFGCEYSGLFDFLFLRYHNKIYVRSNRYLLYFPPQEFGCISRLTESLFLNEGGATAEGKSKLVPLKAWSGSEDSRELKFPDFVTTAQGGGRLSVLLTGHIYVQEILLVLISVRSLVDQTDIVRLEGLYINEKSTDTSWDRNSDLPICSTTP